MIRTSLVAFLFLGLAVGLIAKEPDSELEAITVSIMTRAFQVGDYDTVEALFGKLSPENKKKFLQDALVMSEVGLGVDSVAATPQTSLDLALIMRSKSTSNNEAPEIIERWAEQKRKQTQLLGRLTLSLFEPAAGEKVQVAVEVMQPTPLIVHELDYHSVPQTPPIHHPYHQPVYTAAHLPPPAVPPVPHFTPYQTHGGYTVHHPFPMQQPIVAPTAPMPPSVPPSGVYFTPDQTHSYRVHLTPPPVQQPILPPPPSPTTHVHFLGVEGLAIRYHDQVPGTFDSAPLICPALHNFQQGAIYRLKLSNIPGHPGKELFPTFEVAPVNAQTQEFLAHSAVPVEFTDCDFEHVFAGNFVTKAVYYFPYPEFQGTAMSGVATLNSRQLQPGVDPIIEASKRGSILAVIRMGNRDLSSVPTPVR